METSGFAGTVQVPARTFASVRMSANELRLRLIYRTLNRVDEYALVVVVVVGKSEEILDNSAIFKAIGNWEKVPVAF